MSKDQTKRFCLFDGSGHPFALYTSDIYPPEKGDDGIMGRNHMIPKEAVEIDDDVWSIICREPQRVTRNSAGMVLVADPQAQP